MVASFALSQLAALPDALLALWLMLLAKGLLEHRPGMVQGAAIGLACRPPQPGFYARSARACSAAPRQGDDPRSSPTSRNCRHRS